MIHCLLKLACLDLLFFLWNPNKVYSYPHEDEAAAMRRGSRTHGSSADGSGKTNKRAGHKQRSGRNAAALGTANGDEPGSADAGENDPGALEDETDESPTMLTRGPDADWKRGKPMFFYEGASHAHIFDVRIGPDYKKNKQKAPSAAAPFELMDVRLYKTERKVGQITTRVPFPPMDGVADGDQIFVFHIEVRCCVLPTLCLKFTF